jgi:tellurium resistance protein TerZ
MNSVVNLSKGGTVNLSKASSTPLQKLTLGVGWDMASKPSSGFLGGLFGGGSTPDSIDLDASAILFDDNKRVIESVYFGHLHSSNNSVHHLGDNLTGEGDGDDEQIVIDLPQLPRNVAHIVFTVSSFRGQTFDQVAKAFCRVVNNQTGAEMARMDLSSTGSHTAIVLSKLSRDSNGEFQFSSIAQTTNGRTVKDLAVVASQQI